MILSGTAGLLLVHALPAVAYLANFTIDDTLAQYGVQEGLWDGRYYEDGCAACLPQPGPRDGFGHTWHAKTTFPGEASSNISLSFYGSAVYVFFILANNVSFPDANTYLAFHLDGEEVPSGTFNHLHVPAVGGEEFLYNQIVFASGALQVGQHSMLIRSTAQANNASLALFDYALYSDELQTPSSSHVLVPASTITVQASSRTRRDVRLSVGAAVGAGAVMACLSVAALAFWIVRRRKHHAARTNPAGPSPRAESGDSSPDAHPAQSRSLKVARLGLVLEKPARGGGRRAASRRAGSDRPPHYAP